MSLQAGDLVPHTVITTVDARRVDYVKEIWQRQNLVLAVLPREAAAAPYAAALHAQIDHARDSICLVTHDPLPELAAPALLVADRWGEIAFVCAAATVSALPPAEEAAAWLDLVQRHCPECWGETR